MLGPQSVQEERWAKGRGVGDVRDEGRAGEVINGQLGLFISSCDRCVCGLRANAPAGT